MTETGSTEMDEIFRKALASGAEHIEGLTALDCGTWGTAAPLARLCFAGNDGNDAYYVHAGLVHDAGLRAERWGTRVSAVRAPEEGERRYALDVRMDGPGARDGRLLASLVLTAVVLDQADHSGETGDGS
jgi:hypothetical protein